MSRAEPAKQIPPHAVNTPSPADAGLVRCGLLNRLLLAVGGDEGIDQAEQLLLGLRRHAFDEPEATFQPRADGGCGGLALGADAEQFVGGDVERLGE
jgi:hypothetical protein